MILFVIFLGLYLRFYPSHSFPFSWNLPIGYLGLIGAGLHFQKSVTINGMLGFLSVLMFRKWLYRYETVSLPFEIQLQWDLHQLPLLYKWVQTPPYAGYLYLGFYLLLFWYSVTNLKDIYSQYQADQKASIGAR